jgi:hypothetical protein
MSRLRERLARLNGNDTSDYLVTAFDDGGFAVHVIGGHYSYLFRSLNSIVAYLENQLA